MARFVERTSEPDFVYIFPGDGCYSSVGQQVCKNISLGIKISLLEEKYFHHLEKIYAVNEKKYLQGGLQLLSLGPGCVQHGVVVHELLHTLGLWHEQSRLDRDNIYNIYIYNIYNIYTGTSTSPCTGTTSSRGWRISSPSIRLPTLF